MTLQTIADRILYIQEHAEDHEHAHAAEDALRRDFLRALAQGEIKTLEEAKALASLVLTTETIAFPRHTG